LILKITDLRERKGDSNRERGKIFEGRENLAGSLSEKVRSVESENSENPNLRLRSR